jgi:hypothetical protein
MTATAIAAPTWTVAAWLESGDVVTLDGASRLVVRDAVPVASRVLLTVAPVDAPAEAHVIDLHAGAPVRLFA